VRDVNLIDCLPRFVGVASPRLLSQASKRLEGIVEGVLPREDF
jgi:hypothetical protein